MTIWTALAAATLCAIASPGHSGEAGPPPPQKSETLIRVLLSGGGRAASARVSSPSGFNLLGSGGSLMARGNAGAAWRIERDGRRVRAVRPDGVPTVWAEGSIRAQPVGSGLMALDGSPYRGDLVFTGSDSGLAEINALSIEDYLLGVVPQEMGERPPGDSAAVQAQAVTARSYAYIHLAPSRAYDVTSGVLDQVYGGVAAETAVGSQAVESTRWIVVMYAGRVVNAPYHSACGGSTAAASEIWRTNDEPYLRAVSDRIPGTNRFYCDGAPRFAWTRAFDATTLNAAVAQYLATYASVPGRKPGAVRDISIASHTPSGRVGTLTVSTERGNFVLRGNDIRFVLRKPGGEILESTYFSVATAPAPDGSLARLTLHGMGYGHGVGMCQWGAIGRARAGQDFREILQAYYPGTTIGPAP
ncbi:MAG TPA: SpoIID/LytB domain-containing protein [Gemmatimonadaceae bacterium]|nr:SpoIID/LytB domain-containing protein [Gemmatimonadaceae bacterium]